MRGGRGRPSALLFWDSGAKKRIEAEVEQDSSIFAEDMALSTGFVVELGGCFADVAIKDFPLSFIGQPREISSSVSPCVRIEENDSFFLFFSFLSLMMNRPLTTLEEEEGKKNEKKSFGQGVFQQEEEGSSPPLLLFSSPPPSFSVE